MSGRRNDGRILRGAYGRAIRHLRALRALYLLKADDLTDTALDANDRERLDDVRVEVDAIVAGIHDAIVALEAIRGNVERQAEAYNRLPSKAYKPRRAPGTTDAL